MLSRTVWTDLSAEVRAELRRRDLRLGYDLSWADHRQNTVAQDPAHLPGLLRGGWVIVMSKVILSIATKCNVTSPLNRP